MGVEKRVHSFRLDEELVERLKYYATKQNRKISNFVETTLKEELDRLDEKEKNM